MTLLNCPSSLQPPSLFMLMTFFSHKKFLLQLQCPLFNSTSILFHCGLPLVISPSTPTKPNTSRKSPSFLTSLSPLFLNGSQLGQVNSFKYLGIIITSNLSWSPHIQFVCSKTHQAIGTICHNFYKHASPHSLLTLYQSLVIPYFSYCSSVWDPPVSSTNAEIIEKTQHFALKLCSHKWDNDYSSLLSTFNFLTLSTHRRFVPSVFSL